MEIAFRELNSIMGKINGAYHDICTRLGLSDSEFDIYYMICNLGEGCNQSALYKNSGLGKSTINSALKKMEKEGYLTIEKGEGRNTRVFLTDAGRISAIISFSRTLVFQVLVVIILPMIWGINGIWWATFIAELIAMSISAYYLVKAKGAYLGL